MWIAAQYAGNAAIYAAHDHSLLRYVAPNGDQLMVSESSTGLIYAGTVVGGAYQGAGGGSVGGWSAWQWHHIAFTYSIPNKRYRLYIDGVLINEGDYAAVETPAAGGSFTVDGDPFGNNSAFMVDEMRILNTEQTPQEIQSDALRTAAFADNEIYEQMSSLSGGTIGFQAANASGGSCGSASFAVVTLSNVNPPAGLLPTGSTSTPLTFTTSQATACRYSVGSAVPWSSMQPFDSAAATTHNGTISGLSPDPRVTTTVNFACDVNTAYSMALTYRSVAGPYGPYPHIGSIWSGEYMLTSTLQQAQASQIQLFLGAGFTPAQAVQIRSVNPNVLILARQTQHHGNRKRLSPSVPARLLPAGYTRQHDPGLAGRLRSQSDQPGCRAVHGQLRGADCRAGRLRIRRRFLRQRPYHDLESDRYVRESRGNRY